MPKDNVVKLDVRSSARTTAAPLAEEASRAPGEIVIFPGLDIHRIQAAWAFWRSTGRTYRD